MNSIQIALGVAAGICFYASLYHFLVGLRRRPMDPVHLLFAMTAPVLRLHEFLPDVSAPGGCQPVSICVHYRRPVVVDGTPVRRAALPMVRGFLHQSETISGSRDIKHANIIFYLHTHNFAGNLSVHGIAHLQIKTEMIVQLFIAPPEACFERLQPDQPVDRHVRPGGVIDVQVRKGLFIDPAEEVAIEILCPGVR
jgi:hypothetical protein